jgi:hypothetical protein
MMRKAFLILFSLVAAFPALAAPPAWVTTYGVQVPYPVQTHFSGFGMVPLSGDEGAALDNAKARAAAALSAQVKVSVAGEVSVAETETNGVSTSDYASRVRTSTNLEIPGIQYLVEKDKKNIYVLAWVERKTLLSVWEKESRSQLAALGTAIDSAEKTTGTNVALYEAWTRTLPLFGRFYDAFSLYTAIGGSEELFFKTESRFAGRAAVSSAEQKVLDTLFSLRKGEIKDLGQAFFFLTEQLALQNIKGSSFRISPLSYRETDFSSPFGRFCSGRLENEFSSRLSGGSETIVFNGYYLDQPEEGMMEMGVVARDKKGKVLGSARITAPLKVVPKDMVFIPENLDQALSDSDTIRQQSVTPGAIHVEVWTEQGGSGDNLVYKQGDKIRFLFRVNRPAFLRLTYILATGEKVLMEDRFYIGMDQVNQVVEYPVLITPAPPYGVERLVVTAYGTEPPKAEVFPQKIAGQWYDVFKDMNSVYSATRGFQKVSDTSVLPVTGETSLSLTMTETVK